MGQVYGVMCDRCEKQLVLKDDLLVPPDWTIARVQLNNGTRMVDADVLKCPECSKDAYSWLYQEGGAWETKQAPMELEEDPLEEAKLTEGEYQTALAGSVEPSPSPLNVEPSPLDGFRVDDEAPKAPEDNVIGYDLDGNPITAKGLQALTGKTIDREG